MSVPAKYDMWATHSSASNTIHGSRTRALGIASTASGTSHSEYCGLHTLLVSRNAAMTRKDSCAIRGQRGAVSPMTSTPTQHSRNSTSETVLRFSGACPCWRFGSKPAQPVSPCAIEYRLSGLAPRSVLSRKNSRQPVGNGSITGRLSTSHEAAAVAPACSTGLMFRRRIATTSSGPNRKIGYSFAATPTPSATPAQPGLPRAQSSSPSEASATAMTSKLVNAWNTTSGHAATKSVSHGRRPDDLYVAHTATIQNMASATAESAKYATTSTVPGTRAAQPLAACAMTYWYTPVTTGYSMYRTVPSSSVHEYLYGKAPLLSPSAP